MISLYYKQSKITFCKKRKKSIHCTVTKFNVIVWGRWRPQR